MYSFVLSAPGTISLYGGPDAMRRKQRTVSASVDMRTTLAFTLLPAGAVSEDFIEMEFSSIKLHVQIPLGRFNEYFSRVYNSLHTDSQLFVKIQGFISLLGKYRGTYKYNNHVHRLNLQAFLYSLVLIIYKRQTKITQSFSVKVSTDVPIDLGRSTSIAVCLVACFWRWSLLQEGSIRNKFEHDDLHNIAHYAQNCTRTIYNSSNLMDTLTSTHGGINVFEEQKPTDCFPEMPNMRILLVNPNINHQENKTKQNMVEAVRRISTCINSILDSIDAISIQFIHTLNEINHAEARLLYNGNAENQTSLINNYQILLDLIRMNQGLLKALGMSNPNLDIICAIARDFSLAGKMASKNANEYAFILLPPNTQNDVINRLLTELKLHNFTAKITRLCCSGLSIE